MIDDLTTEPNVTRDVEIIPPDRGDFYGAGAMSCLVVDDPGSLLMMTAVAFARNASHHDRSQGSVVRGLRWAGVFISRTSGRSLSSSGGT